MSFRRSIQQNAIRIVCSNLHRNVNLRWIDPSVVQGRRLDIRVNKCIAAVVVQTDGGDLERDCELDCTRVNGELGWTRVKNGNVTFSHASPLKPWRHLQLLSVLLKYAPL